MEEEKLIKSCQEGNKEAFEKLITMYHPFVYKFLMKLTEREQVAEDLTQETFLKIIRSIDKFDISGRAKFSTYLITVSKNCYIDFIRKEKKFENDIALDTDIVIEEGKTNIENEVINKILSEEVMNKLQHLSEDQRIVIRMKYIEGLTLKEIGEKLELQPKTVKSRIHNGIEKLRNMLKREG